MNTYIIIDNLYKDLNNFPLDAADVKFCIGLNLIQIHIQLTMDSVRHPQLLTYTVT
jgi:hypothetical protein